MRRPFRVLVIIAGGFLLYHGTGMPPLRAQQFCPPLGMICCTEANAKYYDSTDWQAYPCNNYDHKCCTGQLEQHDVPTCSDGGGWMGEGAWGDRSIQRISDGLCGDTVQPGINGCVQGDTCPTYMQYGWYQDDRCLEVCHNAPDICGSTGCCPGYYCDVDNHCHACSMPLPCYPTFDSYWACGTTACNGSCIPECYTNSDCDEDFTCVNGCCEAEPSGGGGGGGGGGGQCQEYFDGMYDWCYLNGVPNDGPCDPDEYCNTDDCRCEGDIEDPIVIDLSGQGYALTSLQDGVLFDFFRTGIRRLTSWTAAWAGVGFLALDRNGNGRIDDGTELFSNISPQPKHRKNGNGFLALAEFDKPEAGGNGDRWITNADAVYSRLLVWVDKNHDGISQANELFSLTQVGVEAISLKYKKSNWTDDYGNVFRYRTTIIWCCQSSPQWIYDVILQRKIKR